jgi:hypothetical protein
MLSLGDFRRIDCPQSSLSPIKTSRRATGGERRALATGVPRAQRLARLTTAAQVRALTLLVRVPRNEASLPHTSWPRTHTASGRPRRLPLSPLGRRPRTAPIYVGAC